MTTGVGAAGIAVTDILLAAGARTVIGCDEGGAVHRERTGLSTAKAAYAERTNPACERGTADELLAGADVFLGFSVPGAISAEGVSRMRDGRDRLRAREPDAGDRARGAAAGQGRRRRDGPLRLPEPDQQRARLPGRLPRRARRRASRDHRGDEARRVTSARGGHRAGRARRRSTSSRASSTATSRRSSRQPSPRQPSRTASRARPGRERLRSRNVTACGRRPASPAGRPRSAAMPQTRRRGLVGEPWVPPRRLTRSAAPRAGSASPLSAPGRSPRESPR